MMKRFHDWIIGSGGGARKASRCKSAKTVCRQLSLERMEDRTLLSADFGGSIEQVMAELEDADGGFIPVYEPTTEDLDSYEPSDSCAIRPFDGEYVRIENPPPQQSEVRSLILKDLLPPEYEGGMIDVAPLILKPVFEIPTAANAPMDQGDDESESGGYTLPAEVPLSHIVSEGSRGKSCAFELAFALDEALPRPPRPEEIRPLSPLQQVEPVSASDLPEIRPVPEVDLPGHVQRSPGLRPRQAVQEPVLEPSETLISQHAQSHPVPVAAVRWQPIARDRPESGHGRAARQQPEFRLPDDVQLRSVFTEEPSTVERTAVGLAARDAVSAESAEPNSDTDPWAIRTDRSRGDDVVTFLAVAMIGHRMIRRQAKSSTAEGGIYQIPPKRPVARNTDPSR